MRSSDSRSMRARSASVTSGCLFLSCSRFILRICANNCCIIWVICCLLAMTSKSFWTSSLETASGATETVVCAPAHRDKARRHTHNHDVLLIDTPLYKISWNPQPAKDLAHLPD